MNLLRTSFLIAYSFLRNFGPLEGGRSIVHGAGQLLKAIFTKESDLSRARMEVCKKCQMYSSVTDTCGEIGSTYQETVVTKTIEFKRLKTLGCWCVCRYASRLPEKKCWAREHDLDFGWPEELRP